MSVFALQAAQGNLQSFSQTINPGGYRFCRIPVQQTATIGASDNINIYGGQGVDTNVANYLNMFIRAHPQVFQYMFLFADA